MPGRMVNLRDGRSYRDVVNGKIQRNSSDGLKKKIPREEGVEWLEVDVGKCPDIQETLSRCVIGGVKKGEMLENMEQILTDGGIVNCKWRALGGLDVLIECGTVGEAEEIVKNNDHGIKEWMQDLRFWTKDYVIKSRLTWIKLYGVPIDAWSEKNFKKIACMWGSVIKTENCDFYAATTLVAGRILISTNYEFPLEKEIVVKLDNRKVWVMVKDEGWVDEIADEGEKDEEDSSYNPSEEEEDEYWGDDISDVNSVQTIPVGEEWDIGDRDVGERDVGERVAGGQDSSRSHGERSAWNDGSLPKVWIRPGIEESTHDIGDPPCGLGGLNGLLEKQIHNGSRAHEGRVNERRMEMEGEHVDRTYRKWAGPGIDDVHSSDKEAQCGKINGVEENSIGLENSEAQIEDKILDEKLDNYEEQWSDSQKLDFAYDELEARKKSKKSNRLGKKVRSGLQENVDSRNTRTWDGSRSMRMFNKLVRDRNKRRSMICGKGGDTNKRMSCPKAKISGKLTSSRNSIEETEDQIEVQSDENQSLKQFGVQIGFKWEKDAGLKKEIQVGESREKDVN
ncbi:hypothetical protein L1887_38936 [Cichorium endivia]|nr:hypothetical protein L1887_38936 [Cichorium endivia]